MLLCVSLHIRTVQAGLCHRYLGERDGDEATFGSHAMSRLRQIGMLIMALILF